MKPAISQARSTAVWGGMASYLDAATIVSASIGFVFYKLGGLPIDATAMGALAAILTLGLAVGALVGGRLGDLYGRRRVFSIDLLVFVAGLSLLTFGTGLPAFFAGVTITGLAMGADLPVSIALVGEAAPRSRRGRMVSLTQLMWLFGILASAIVSNIVGWLGLPAELSGRIMFGHVLFAGAVVWLLRRRLPESQEWIQAKGADRTTPSVHALIPRSDPTRYLPALAATGLFYLCSNLQANTGGQFNTYLFTEVAGGQIATANLVGLITLPLGVAASLVAILVVDTRWRMPCFAVGGLLTAAACLPAAIWGVSVPTMLIAMTVPGLTAAFAGEGLYKVWTQEHFPTLLRSSAQGSTIFFCRALTAVFALVTPLLAEANPAALFFTLAATSTAAWLIGLLWIPRLPHID